MIRVESCIFPTETEPSRVYLSLLQTHQSLDDLQGKIDTKMLILPKQEHALVSRLTPVSRLGAAQKLTALVLEKPTTPLSCHLASFSLTDQGLTSLSLPAEHVLIDQKPTKPGQVINFMEEYNQEVAGWVVAWFQQMVSTNLFIEPPCLFVSSSDLI